MNLESSALAGVFLEQLDYALKEEALLNARKLSIAASNLNSLDHNESLPGFRFTKTDILRIATAVTHWPDSQMLSAEVITAPFP